MRYKFVSLRFEIVNAFSFRIRKYCFRNGKGNKTYQSYINILCFILSVLWTDKQDEIFIEKDKSYNDDF